MRTKRQFGMSLIEIMIGIVVAAILLALGAPEFSRGLQNSQIRTSAESIQNGLMLARAEAVRRNRLVRFQLVTTTGNDCALSDQGRNWVISLDDPTNLCGTAPFDEAAAAPAAPRIIQVRAAGEGSPNAAINGVGTSLISFTGTGRATAAASFNITNPSGGNCATQADRSLPMRCLRVTVSTGGQVRMCDPARDAAPTQANMAGDPQGC